MDRIYFIEYDNWTESEVCYQCGFFYSLDDAEHFAEKLGEHYWVRELDIHEEKENGK